MKIIYQLKNEDVMERIQKKNDPPLWCSWDSADGRDRSYMRVTEMRLSMLLRCINGEFGAVFFVIGDVDD